MLMSVGCRHSAADLTPPRHWSIQLLVRSQAATVNNRWQN